MYWSRSQAGLSSLRGEADMEGVLAPPHVPHRGRMGHRQSHRHPLLMLLPRMSRREMDVKKPRRRTGHGSSDPIRSLAVRLIATVVRDGQRGRRRQSAACRATEAVAAASAMAAIANGVLAAPTLHPQELSSTPPAPSSGRSLERPPS